MITDNDIYIDVSPVDLWRCGDDKSPLLDHIRTEGRPPLFRVDMEIKRIIRAGQTLIMVVPNQGGVSVFDNINPRLQRGFWWRIPKGSLIPAEIYIRKDAGHGVLDITHYSLCPRFEMELERFRRALRLFSQFAIPVLSAAEVKR